MAKDMNELLAKMGNARTIMNMDESTMKSYASGAGIPDEVDFSAMSMNAPMDYNPHPVNIKENMGNIGQIPSNSKLPKEILESFSKTPNISPQASSVLDNISPDAYEAMRTKMVNEQRQAKAQQRQQRPIREQAVAGGIDYSLIKTIIDESVKKHMAAYTKKILSEQKNTGTVNESLGLMQIGKGFKFVTKNGDLYEATLEFKGNINKK